MQHRLSNLWLKLAGLYFFIGVALGVGMGLSGDHHLFPLHAHINLLGWVSMALFGLIGRVLEPGRVLKAHSEQMDRFGYLQEVEAFLRNPAAARRAYAK